MANIFPIEFTFSRVFALKHAECKISASSGHSLHQLWHFHSLCSVQCGRNTTSKVDNVVCTISQGGTLADVLHPESSMQRLWQFALTAAAAALICCLNFLFVAATSLPVLCPYPVFKLHSHQSQVNTDRFSSGSKQNQCDTDRMSSN